MGPGGDLNILLSDFLPIGYWWDSSGNVIADKKGLDSVGVVAGDSSGKSHVGGEKLEGWKRSQRYAGMDLVEHQWICVRVENNLVIEEDIGILVGCTPWCLLAVRTKLLKVELLFTRYQNERKFSDFGLPQRWST